MMDAIDDKTSIKIHNKSCAFEIDKKTGMISGFSMFGDGHAQWDDIVEGKLIYNNRAGVRIKDELLEKEYKDPFGRGRVFYHEPRKLVNLGKGDSPICARIKIEKNREVLKIIFTKTYNGAPFALKYEFLVHDDFVRWDIVLKLNPREKERSVFLEYALPIFRSVDGGYFPAGWKAWVPIQDAPFDFGVGGGWGHAQASWYVHHFPYCSVNAGGGIGLPIMDIYNTARDFGLCIAAPPDLLKPEVVFIVDKESSQLKVSYGNMGLRKNNEWRTSLMIFPHRGDWRSALGWFHGKYRKYFEPNNRKIIEQEGAMYYGMPTPEKTIKSWVDNMRLKWTELCYNHIFGDYVPEAKVWDFDMLADSSHPVIKNLSKDKIREYLRVLKKHGVASFVYFNYGECDKDLALEKFPESIIRHDHGIRGAWIAPNGRKNVTMNPDPDSKWGDSMLKQVEEIFDTYEDMDGLFIDQICYHSYDYSKDDGRTMVDNKPVSDTHEASCRMMAKIAAILKRRNKTSFANGPYNIEVARCVDGIMSEGSMAGLAKYSYLCLEKPVMVLTYNIFGDRFENVLKRCLKYGAFPSTPWHHADSFNPPAAPPKRTLMLYQKYLPLIEELRGRRWVLSSDPVSFPDGMDGNIFHKRGGGYVLPFYSRDVFTSDEFWNNKNPKEIKIRLPGLKKLTNVIWMSDNFKGRKTLPTEHVKGEMTVRIPEYTNASVLLF